MGPIEGGQGGVPTPTRVVDAVMLLMFSPS
jgi:hypothetical protein